MSYSTHEMATRLLVLEGARPATVPSWSGALAPFFDLGRDVLRRLHTDIRTNRLRSPSFLLGRSGEHGMGDLLDTLMNSVDIEYPIVLQSPFEATDSIAGALWSGRELLGADRDDGLAKLCFAPGTQDLPLHVHEESDRFIAVLEGSGTFHWSGEDWHGFRGTDVRNVPVRAGDVLIFTRWLLHTFSTSHEALTLLSYHSPEIPFDDPRQYTIPALRWTPKEVPMQ